MKNIIILLLLVQAVLFVSCRKESSSPNAPEKIFEIIGTLQDSAFAYDSVTIFVRNFDPRTDTISGVFFDSIECKDFVLVDSTKIIARAVVPNTTNHLIVVLNKRIAATLPFVVHFPETNFSSCSIVAPKNNFNFLSSVSGVKKTNDSIVLTYSKGQTILKNDLSLIYFQGNNPTVIVHSTTNICVIPKCYSDRIVYHYISDTAFAIIGDKSGMFGYLKEIEVELKY